MVACVWTICFILIFVLDGHAFMNDLLYECTCLAAREHYLLKYSEVAAEKLDPLIHYQNVGKNLGYKWECELCCDEPRFTEESFCNCSAAIDQFFVDFPETASYIPPHKAFETYFHNPNLTLSWDCSLCEKPPFSGTIPHWCYGGAYTPPPQKQHFRKNTYDRELQQKYTFNPRDTSASSGGLTYNETCLKARYDFWDQNFLVYSENQDPVIYYLNAHANGESLNWSSALCNVDPQYIEDATLCNCTAAIDRFFLDYPDMSISNGDAYGTYLALHQAGNSTAWHCELCTGENPIKYPFPLAYEQTCLVARGAYQVQYAGRVQKNNYDPVGYYMVLGDGTNWPWGRCGFNDIWVQNTQVCNCSQAISTFINDFKLLPQSVPHLAYRFYITYFPVRINVHWNCVLCLNNTSTTTALPTSSPTPSPSSSTTGPSSAPTSTTTAVGLNTPSPGNIKYALSQHCTCLNARYTYWGKYPAVYGNNIDPVYHYQNFGGGEGKEWSCGDCNVNPVYIDNSLCNCTNARADFQVYYNLSTTYDPFSYYLTQYNANGGDAWHCELCNLPIVSTSDGTNKKLALIIVVAVLVPAAVILAGVFAYIYQQRRRVLKSMVMLGEREAYAIDLGDVTIGKLIGAGSFGYVYQGEYHGADVAIKKLKHQNMTKQQLADFVNEANVMIGLRNPNVVLFMGVCLTPPDLCIVTEFMPRGSLYEVIHDPGIKLNLPLILSIALDALKGLQYIHSAGILHRDLKSPNLLVDNKWTIKIADFGLSCAKDTNSNDVEISLLWTAPEILMRQKNCYSEKSDLYSFGIILWELMSRRTPFDEYMPAAIAPAIVAGQRPPVDPGWLIAVQNAMQGCWQQTPEMRSNLQEVRTLLDTARSACIYALTPSPVRGPTRTPTTPPDIPRINLDGSTYVPPIDAHNTDAHMHTESPRADAPLMAGRADTPRNDTPRREIDPNNPLESPQLIAAMWPEQRNPAPVGVIALVFTDVQSSSKLWEADPRMMVAALKLHNKICTDLLEKLQGYEVKTDGDAFMYAFGDPMNAVNFCLRVQAELVKAPWSQKLLDIPACAPMYDDDGEIYYRGLRIRMGIHVGEPSYAEDPITLRMDYFGPVVMSAARISAYANGAQILVNPDMYVKVIAGIARLDPFLIETIGRCCMKGIKDPVTLYQIVPAALKHRLKAQTGPADDGIDTFLKTKVTSKLPPVMSHQQEPETYTWSPAHHEKWIIEFEELEMGRKLGVGTYGDVHAASYRGKRVAVKKFLRQHVGENALLEMRMEGGILSSLDHPNILNFKGMCIKIPNLCIVTELLDRGSLSFILYSDEPISWKRRVQFAVDIANGLKYLHAHNIIHRDVKSPNMLVGSDWTVKIGDFGFSRIKVEHTTMTQCGTVAWTAPEIFSGSHYSEKADIYSFGIILWELVYRRKPWDGLNAMRIIHEVELGNRPPTHYIPTDTPPLITQLMEACWNYDSEKRPSITDILATLQLALPKHPQDSHPLLPL